MSFKKRRQTNGRSFCRSVVEADGEKTTQSTRSDKQGWKRGVWSNSAVSFAADQTFIRRVCRWKKLHGRIKAGKKAVVSSRKKCNYQRLLAALLRRPPEPLALVSTLGMNGVDVDICSHAVILFLFVIGIKNPHGPVSHNFTQCL